MNVELREGSQHCQKGTATFLVTSITYVRRITDRPLLARMDAGNESADNLKVCPCLNADYIIKVNLRKEPKET